MDLRQLRCFAAFADKLHFGRAAASVNLTESAFWRQIKNLEQDLGVPLIQRQRRGTRLTTAGEIFARKTQVVLDSLQDARRDATRAAQGRVGQLTIGIPRVFSSHPVVLEVLSRFHKSHPEVDLQAMSPDPTQMSSILRDGEVDGIFAFSEVLAGPDFDTIALETRRPVLAMSANHTLAKQKKIRLRDLRDEEFLWFSRESRPHAYDQILVACVEKGGFSPKIVQRADDGYLAFNLVSAGLGVMFTFGIAPGEYLSGSRVKLVGDLVAKYVEEVTVKSHFTFSWNRRNRSSTLERFVDVLRQVLAASKPARAVGRA